MFVLRLFLGSFPCLCLDLYVFAQIYMFVSRSTCLCLDLCVYVLRAMLVCLDLCWLLCHVLLQPFCLLISIFLTFWPFQWGVDLDPMVQAYIRTLRPISKGLDHFLYTYPCLLACFYALYPCQPHQIQALLCALCPPWVCAQVVRSVPSRVCLDVTTYEIHLYGVGVLTLHLSLPCAMLIRLPCLLCTTRLAFFASLHTCLHVHA